MTRVAIVHHDQRVIDIIQRAIRSQFKVIWTANQAQDAIQKCKKNLPEMLLLDLDVEDQAVDEVVKQIMLESPCGILILTNDLDKDANLVFKTLLDGALEVAAAPEPDLVPRIKIEQLISKMQRLKSLFKPAKKPLVIEPIEEESHLPLLLIIGASTGGPAALVHLLSGLPKKPPIAVIIIQHINERFTAQLANWLEQQIGIPVELASSGDVPVAGKILLSKANQHLVFNERLQLIYTDQPFEAIHRPSVDVFFSSAAEFWPEKAVAVLLTGMGSDGAEGMKKLHDIGWFTVAQHPDGCAVYGMPRAAAEKQAASEILKIDEMAPIIGSKIASLSLNKKRSRYE